MRELIAFGADRQAAGELYQDDGETSAWRTGGTVTTFAMVDGILTRRSEGPDAPGFETMPIRRIERGD